MSMQVVTQTQIELQDDFDNFDAAWASVEERVREFVRNHPGARISIDDTGGRRLAISLMAIR